MNASPVKLENHFEVILSNFFDFFQNVEKKFWMEEGNKKAGSMMRFLI